MAKTFALIPARGGSKGISRKNLQPVGGVPLIVRSIRHAQQCPGIDAVYVSTEDAEIAAVAQQAGAQVIHRPLELAADTSSTESAIGHAIEAWKDLGEVPDSIVLLQCTSPFRRAGQLDAALTQFATTSCDSLLSVTRDHSFFWQPRGFGSGATAVNYDPTNRPRRQDHDGVLRETGSFYIFRTGIFLHRNSRLGGHVETFEVPAEDALEIDDPRELELARFCWQQRGEAFHPFGIDAISWLVLDVDGTLTDGTLSYHDDGSQAKVFHTRDGHGISLWKERGGKVAWITRDTSDTVIARATKLGVDHLVVGCHDKAHAIEVLCHTHNASREQLVTMGDDLFDLPMAQASTLFVCPHDAVPEVRAVADYITSAPGGRGAVRELVDLLLRAGALAQQDLVRQQAEQTLPAKAA